MTPLDSLPVWVQPKVKAMLEDLRERAAKAAELWGESAAEKKRSGFNEEEREFYAGQRHVMGNFAAFLRALPLTPDSAPPEKEETCDCGRLEDPHERTGDCPAHACMYCRDKFSRVAGQHFVNGEWTTPCIEWEPPAPLPPVEGEEKDECGEPMSKPCPVCGIRLETQIAVAVAAHATNVSADRCERGAPDVDDDGPCCSGHALELELEKTVRWVLRVERQHQDEAPVPPVEGEEKGSVLRGVGIHKRRARGPLPAHR